MSYRATVYKVLIASPGDVPGERQIIREVLHEWNAVNSEKRGIVLLPVGWETHSSPEMGDHPQALINKQLASACDLLVGVFWTRLGTPTDQYMSGSVEEIEEHIKASKVAMLYFSSAPVELDSVDHEQYSRLKAFKESCKTRGLFEPYSNLGEFKDKLYRHIQLKVNQHESFNAEGPAEEVVPPGEPAPAMDKLTREAAFMLKSATDGGEGMIMHLRHLGGCVIHTGSVNFVEDQGARNIALWEGVIDELESFGLIRAANAKREMFRVTREGYEIAEIVDHNRGQAMPNAYVEPLPKGNHGAIDGYALEYADNRAVANTPYPTQGEAIAAAKALGLKPLTARVRVTSKSNPDHWRLAD
ncbi:hypothetical protein R69776_03354 [Paraburkholderia nemoris]|uniref:DUF4062 domain-containing protein n=1 Tax=Paraburkholderia nemoris TaxID=2793076 RepID=A0ABN7LNI8_9BURK|nr:MULTISPECIES: hypothetical protein [Paraburkholderia]CAE6760633.1 hypothetical protein R69776_03354 [Paraburkholderia nemoris]